LSESSADRRAHERVDTSLELQGTPEKGGVVARMVASNLSQGGLQCTSTADFPEMTRLAVRLLLPTNGSGPSAIEPLDLEAVVVRRQQIESRSGEEQRFELALFFTQVDDDARARLAGFVDRPSSAKTYH